MVAAEGQSTSLRLDRREAGYQTDLSALGALKSALSDLQGKVRELDELSAFESRLATSSNEDLFTTTADENAVAGSYALEVNQLAKSAKIRSGDFLSDSETVGSGTMTLSLGANSFQITVGATNNTLADIRNAINASSDNPGITASIINVDSGAQLVLTSDKVGAVNAIAIAVLDDDANDTDNLGLSKLATANLTTIQTAQDAIIKVDNQQVTRNSNTISDVIAGVTIKLQKAEPGTIETLSVQIDKEEAKKKVEGFVSTYNALAGLMNTLSSFNSETGQAGVMLGDATLRGVQNLVRNIISDPVKGLEFTTLAEIGVTTDESGLLQIDSGKLDNVLASDVKSVARLFADDEGLANRLDDALQTYLSTDGVFSARTKGLKDRIDDVSEQRVKLDRRLAAVETRLRSQFTAMDMLLGQLQSTSTFLTQQLANLPGAIKPKTN